ncbi:hypothetical protein [Streptomyces sp. NPDC058255]|uniref:hypothetical protein n=1 Tax=Streptomyces sp. NPDC058255 TaxID=3346407 RepID=UPI0036E1614C
MIGTGLTGSDQTRTSTDAVHQTSLDERGLASDLASELSHLQLLIRAVRRERDRLGARLEETETALTVAEAELDRQLALPKGRSATP